MKQKNDTIDVISGIVVMVFILFLLAFAIIHFSTTETISIKIIPCVDKNGLEIKKFTDQLCEKEIYCSWFTKNREDCKDWWAERLKEKEIKE